MMVEVLQYGLLSDLYLVFVAAQTVGFIVMIVFRRKHFVTFIKVNVHHLYFMVVDEGKTLPLKHRILVKVLKFEVTVGIDGSLLKVEILGKLVDLNSLNLVHKLLVILLS